MSSDYELSDNEYYDEDDDEEMYDDDDGECGVVLQRSWWLACL